MLKRSFDILVSLLGLILLAPFLAVIGLLVFISSPGPVLYRQTRVGLKGRLFKIFKFRTMVMGAESLSPVTRHNDERITFFGRFLRELKLDEIPQLLNVLWGDMSVVGPRPELPELVAFYTDEQRKLLNVKPGITSPATIYHRDEEEIVGSDQEVFNYHKKVLIPKKASFDLAYVEKVSLLYDLKLILLTLVSVVTRQSGYMKEHALKQRKIFIFLAHLGLSTLSYYLAFVIRFDANISHPEFLRFQKTLALAVLAKIIFLAVFGMGHGYWRYVSARDIINIGKVTLFSTIFMLVVEFLFLDPAFPTGVIVLDGILCFLFFSSLRLSTRFLREAYYPITPKGREKVLVLGAGDRAEAFVRDIQRNPDLAYEIAGLIDLDPNKRGAAIHGFRILGTIDSLEGLLRENSITTIINTYPILSRTHTLALSRLTSRYGVKVKTLPSISEVLSGGININRLRDLKYEDLLGREEVRLDRKLLNETYFGKSVLITGAGGSIGSELVRQIVEFEPRELLLVDKDETLLYNIQTELMEINCRIPFYTLIGDIRNVPKLKMFFAKYNPEILLHAAAYKHVPLLEVHPHEAVQNNIFGTRNLLQLAKANGIKRFVMISTDKAVRPTSVMGASKAMAEKLMFESMEDDCPMKRMAVRFGNVLGSRGSVIPLFRRQIGRGGPIKITHRDITRYFMSIPEAAQLVLQAGAMGQGGEIFILKMGDPVKIRDLAYSMIEHSGLIPEVDIKFQYTGLRHGEKMYEELLTKSENVQTTEHEKIYVTRHVTGETPVTLQRTNSIEIEIFSRPNSEIRAYLKKFVPDYMPRFPVD